MASAKDMAFSWLYELENIIFCEPLFRLPQWATADDILSNLTTAAGGGDGALSPEH